MFLWFSCLPTHVHPQIHKSSSGVTVLKCEKPSIQQGCKIDSLLFLCTCFVSLSCFLEKKKKRPWHLHAFLCCWRGNCFFDRSCFKLLAIHWVTHWTSNLCSHNSNLERQQSNRVTARQSFSTCQIIVYKALKTTQSPAIDSTVERISPQIILQKFMFTLFLKELKMSRNLSKKVAKVWFYIDPLKKLGCFSIWKVFLDYIRALICPLKFSCLTPDSQI